MIATEIQAHKERALSEANTATDAEALEEVRIRYLGRKGLLQEVMKGLKTLEPAERPKAGEAANTLKVELQAALKAREGALTSTSDAATDDTFDYTLPGHWRRVGTRHPISQITERVIEIFHTLGFTVAEGPDIETTFNNFDALNTPPEHPSRDLHDTFYLEDGSLLRTHTSPVQIRYMKDNAPPVRIIAPDWIK